MLPRLPARLALAAVGLFSAAACSADAGSEGLTTRQSTTSSSTVPPAHSGAGAPAEAVVTGTIEAVDQTSDGTTVVVAEVTIRGAAGWVIVHADAAGPGAVVGHAAVPEGTSKNVVVRLDTKVGTGVYWPMLHRDGGVVGTFQWPGGPDGPVRPPGGGTSYATRRITLTVG